MDITVEEIAKIVGLQLGVRQVNGNDSLLKGLGAESIDVLNIIATIEEKYDIFIDETTMSQVNTVADLYQLVCHLKSTDE